MLLYGDYAILQGLNDESVGDILGYYNGDLVKVVVRVVRSNNDGSVEVVRADKGRGEETITISAKCLKKISNDEAMVMLL